MAVPAGLTRERANSAPPATLSYALMAASKPLEVRVDPSMQASSSQNEMSPQQLRTPPSPSRSQAIHPIANPLYCEAVSSLFNPRDPRPFASVLFPSYIMSDDLGGDTDVGSVGGAIRPPMTIEDARGFLDVLDKRLRHRGGVDARSAVTQLAFATLRKENQSSHGNQPSGRLKDDSVTGAQVSKYALQIEQDSAVFYRRKYEEAVEQAERERERFARERDALVSEHRAREAELSEKLRMAERQMALIRENSERSVKSCQHLEEETKHLRKELLESCEAHEKLKEIASRLKHQNHSQVLLSKELQGQLDLYRGSTSVPLLAHHPDLLNLRSENAKLQEENQSLLTRLAQSAMQFSSDKKKLNAELSAALQEVERLTSAATARKSEV